MASSLFAALGSPEFAERMDEFSAFVDGQLDERRAHPRDDFLTQVASGVVDGVTVDSEGATGLLIAYLLGGHHSTGSSIAFLFRELLSRDAVRSSVRSDPKLLAKAVEESLRLNTPLQYFARTALGDVELETGGVPRGRRVLVDLAAANRDPRQFENPDDFDLERRRNPHVAFGAGGHVCLGQHLARAEIRVAISRVLERLPDVALSGAAPEVVVGGKLLTTATLPVTFTPEVAP